MRFFLAIAFMIFAGNTLGANDRAHVFASNSECQTCHPLIYDEYTASQHQKSTVFKDPIHAAVWNKHPKNTKLRQYTCGKCHTPAAQNLDAMLTMGKTALPDPDEATQNEGIACAYCHRITDIEKHKVSNTNIIDPREKRYYATRTPSVESPYHGTVSVGNEHMANGNVCIGCHSHKQNKHGLNVCSTNIANEIDGANCVSCHMPQREGSVSSMTQTKTHAFHGFPGAHAHSEMLAEYVDLSMVRNIETFIVNVDNRSSHALLLHPLRLAVLKVSVQRGGEKMVLKDATFARVIGKGGKPAMPWAADSEVKNTMIAHNEKRALTYDFALRKGDRVEAVLGYYLVNPQAAEKLGLGEVEEATAFHLLKKASFSVR